MTILYRKKQPLYQAPEALFDDDDEEEEDE
jgi:hypothetical protein